ncbi:ATP-dependent DNA helicase RecG [Steroidobacter sp.]|uniref:ATP-dependent DNA helicase RecG n=1 Tax=Steroidobacter sp. TaxID=1978227 RepID=UPI001A5837D0|nr:ATP-dependent DNA helicase RecG [Steroidobacter sp.]MBL8268852.1 ATP-dependent DNA helicase RecG [Steroidobacter sp.]
MSSSPPNSKRPRAAEVPAAAISPEIRPVTALRGVGDALASKLAKLGITTIQDLLFLLPLRYEDRTQVIPIGSLSHGDRAVVEGEVQLAEIAFRGRRQLLCRIGDGSGWLTLRFFHFSNSQHEQMTRGTRLRCYGEVRRGPSGYEIVHPEYRRVASDAPTTNEDVLTPVYPLTEGVQQGRLRQLTAMALREFANRSIQDWVPPAVLAQLEFPPLRDALHYVHRPPPDADLELLAAGQHPMQRRLAFEELLAHQLSLRLLRLEVQRDPGWQFSPGEALIDRFLQTLPFKPTGAQTRAWRDIERDLSQPSPMLRLVQGDVGCGKTLVAALAALRAVEAGFQVAVMAPTELLAEQHARNFTNWLAPLDLYPALVTGKRTAAARARSLADLGSGEAKIVIGTHALFQQEVEFRRLGLVIVDEQHRFGVHQRLLLREKGLASGRYPHQLIMTATPIPRTLAMTAYADLDVSVIDELPPGRTPVKTVALPENRRDEIVLRIRDACRQKRQAYWVCPLIEESDQLEAQAAEETATVLAEALQELKVGLIHGRMPPKEKDLIMSRFKEGAIDLLVATTVIEVGVDVPNASLMVIENAERMGLAQLHQLRGRVGRGAAESTCVLLYRTPLTEVARERLSVMRATNDGFEISRRDLELRGPGELLGTKQTGLMQMRVAELVRDADLLPKVQEVAELMLRENEANIAPLLRRWIGQGERFGKV